MTTIGVAQKIPPIGPEAVFYIGNFPVTNSLLMIWLILALFLSVGFLLIRKFRLNPRRSQTAVEAVYDAMFELVDQITGDRVRTKAIFPIIGALFVYIGAANFIGLVPGLGEITYRGVPIFRSPTADFNTTFGLALAMVLLTHIASIKDWGLFGHLGKFFQFKHVYRSFRQGFRAGLLSMIDFSIGLLDIISEAAKVVSLSVRLFGNMYAGQVLMVVLVGFAAVLLPSVWLAMSLLSALIQAIVFGALVASYYTLSVKPEVVREE